MGGLSLQGFDDGLVRGLSVGNSLVDANKRRDMQDESMAMQRQEHGLSMDMRQQQMRMNDDALHRRDVAEQRQEIADKRAEEQFGMTKETHKLGLENARSQMKQRDRSAGLESVEHAAKMRKYEMEQDQLLMSEVWSQYDPSDKEKRGLNDKQLKFLNDKGMLEKMDSWASPDLRPKIDAAQAVMNDSSLGMKQKSNHPAMLDFINTAFEKEINKGSKGKKRIVGLYPATELDPKADPESVVLMLDVDGKRAPMTVGRDSNPNAPVMQVKLHDLMQKGLAIDQFNQRALAKLDTRVANYAAKKKGAEQGNVGGYKYFSRDTEPMMDANGKPAFDAFGKPIMKKINVRTPDKQPNVTEVEDPRGGWTEEGALKRWTQAAAAYKEQAGVDLFQDRTAQQLFLNGDAAALDAYVLGQKSDK